MSSKDDPSKRGGTTNEEEPPSKRAKSDDDFVPVETAAADAKIVPGMDTGRCVIIKGEQFPVPLLDIEHFSGLSEEDAKQTKRYLDEPHPSVKSPISPFKDGKGGFATGWWLAFHHYDRDLEDYMNIRKDIIVCNLCGNQVKRGERARATSALVQHLKTKVHRKVFDQLAVLWEGKAHDPLVPRTPRSSTGGTRKSLGSASAPRAKRGEGKANQKQIQAITRWIADTNQPLNVVETDSFAQMVATLKATARFDVKATAKNVADEIVTLDAQIQEDNKDAMVGQAVWTTQGFAATSTAFSYLTAHFITETFEAKALMLEAKEQVADPKASAYLEETTTWGITPGMSYAANSTLVSNPGFVSCPETASSTIGSQLEKTKGVLNIEFLDQKLYATAEVALDFVFAEDGKAPSTEQVLGKARELIAVFSTSSQRWAALKKAQEDLPGEYKGQDPLSLVSDSEESWWTTFEMVDRLLKLRPALEKLWSEDRELDGKLMLESSEWDILKQLSIVLKPVVMGVEALESEKFVTASLALVALNMVRGELVKLQSICEDGQDASILSFAPAISKCVAALLAQFDKTWGSLSEPFQGVKPRAAKSKQKGLYWPILFAYALDPRFKTLPHIENKKNQEDLFDALLKEMTQAKKQASSGSSKGEGESGSMMMYMMNRFTGGAKSGSTDETDSACVDELKAYKAETSQSLTDGIVASNPLDWWKINHDRFPTLASLARMFLAIPISAAALEKKFGSGDFAKGDAPVVEMAKQRMNIRSNPPGAEPAAVVTLSSPPAAETADIVHV